MHRPPQTVLFDLSPSASAAFYLYIAPKKADVVVWPLNRLMVAEVEETVGVKSKDDQQLLLLLLLQKMLSSKAEKNPARGALEPRAKRFGEDISNNSLQLVLMYQDLRCKYDTGCMDK